MEPEVRAPHLGLRFLHGPAAGELFVFFSELLPGERFVKRQARGEARLPGLPAAPDPKDRQERRRVNVRQDRAGINDAVGAIRNGLALSGGGTWLSITRQYGAAS